MRRSTRLSLVILGALLVIAGAYTGYWFIVAGQIEDRAAAWAQSARSDKVDVSWRRLRVAGFPGTFRVELETATLRYNALTPSPEFHIPVVFATARPWDFADWRLAARDGFGAEIAGSAERAPAKLLVKRADGVVSFAREGGWKLWLAAQNATLEGISRILVNSADAWIIALPKPLRQQTEPQLALAIEARQMALPVAIEPLGGTIDELDFGATVKGAIPNGRMPQALAAWRDAGGKIELESLRLKWGGLDATASGTISFDAELQPTGALSGGVQGYDEILTALVKHGQMRAADAGLARIALALLAKAGPDGKPEIRTAFTIQNGQMFLGPAKLGKAPRLTWE
jgi:hypothetical protein